MSKANLTRHCHQCGWEWTLSVAPGRSDACHQCGGDMKVCLNCVSHDARAAHQCRDRRADPVADKHLANFCEYLEFIRRTWTPKTGTDVRADAARSQLKRLLGD